MKFLTIFLCCFTFLFVADAGATILNVDNIYTYSVSGAMMDGMAVTADSETAYWQTTGQYSGGAFGTGWSLTFSGIDTWFGTWILSSSDIITNLTIDAYLGESVFDIFDNQDAGGNSNGLNDTPGSERGWWVQNMFTGSATSGYFDQGTEDQVFWSFTDPVKLTAAASPEGDIYGTLSLTFGDEYWKRYTGSQNNDSFLFELDTDRWTPIPEPATMLLMGLGLFGLAGVGSRMRKSKI